MTSFPIKKDSGFVLTGKKFLSDKVSIFISLISFLILLISYFAYYNVKDLEYFPNAKISYPGFFTDDVDKGNSVLNQKYKNDSAVGIQYTLHDGFSFPYAGIELAVKNPGGLDITRFNRIQIKLESNNLKYLTCFLIVKDKTVKDTLNRLANRRLTLELPVSEPHQDLALNISDFSTPDWWYSKINQDKSEFLAPKMNQLVSVIISTGVSPQLNQPGSIALYHIRFYRDNTYVIGIMCLIQFFIMASLFSILYRKRPRPEPITKIDVYYKPIQLDTKPETSNAFLDYIQHHYDNADLSLKLISKNSGVNQRTISDTILEKYNCNFKTYINQIRIVEAKRLLQNSNLNISEVAYKVGFNSPTSFNRVFKSLTQYTPSEFIQNIKNQ
jgi:AraC-like DNA-binding protein